MKIAYFPPGNWSSEDFVRFWRAGRDDAHCTACLAASYHTSLSDEGVFRYVHGEAGEQDDPTGAVATDKVV